MPKNVLCIYIYTLSPSLQEGRTPLHYACAWGSYELVELLLKANSSWVFVNHQDNKGETALHIAGHHGDTKVWKLLRSKNASKVVVNDVSFFLYSILVSIITMIEPLYSLVRHPRR